MMQQLQQSIAVICADATKAYIRSDVNETINAAATQQENQQEQSSSSSKQIYNFLADHFQKLAETKQREQKIAVSRKGVEEVFKWFLEDLMMKKKQNDSDGKEESPFTFSSSEKNKTTFQEASKGISLQAYHTILSTSATPRVNQREITSMLESKNIIINTSALPEVFELARALQQVMQKRLKNNVETLLKVSNTIDAKTLESACSSSSSTFGTTNSLLFLAVFSSLLSVKSLFELLSIIIENCNGSRRLVQLICVTFAAIDVENKNVWNAVVLLLGRSSSSSKSLSVSDLVEQIPSIETMGHGRASTFVDDVEEELFGEEKSSSKTKQTQQQQGPVVVSYDPEDEEGDGRTRREEEQENSDNDNDTEEQQEEEEDAATKNDFWAGLTSGPAS